MIPDGSKRSALEQLLGELNNADRRKRFATIRQVNHVFQRPDLATCDALIEIAHQLARLADGYELITGIEDKRAAQQAIINHAELKAAQEVRIADAVEKALHEERRRTAMAATRRIPPEPEPERRQPLNQILKQYEFEENQLHLSVRTYNILTENGKQARSREELLGFHPRTKPGFGNTAFAELVVGLMRYGRVTRSVLAASELWTSARQKMRDLAETRIAEWKQAERDPEKTPNVTEIQ